MRAAVYRATGPAREVLNIEDIPAPRPGPGDVRVRMQVSGVNPTDDKSRRGANGRKVNGFQVPHHDGAGVIDLVGPDVDRDRVGERVWVWMAAAERPWGTAATWTVLPDDQVVTLPEHVSLDLGASLGVPALTAHRCLFADGPLTDRVVLIAGGAGAVGHFAIQLAKHAGAHVVATVSTNEKARIAQEAGADVVVNYRTTDALTRIASQVGQVDRVVEVAPGANWQTDLALSTPDTVISVYAADDDATALPVLPCMRANATVRFVWLYGVPKPKLTAAARDISAALARGALTELRAHHYPLHQVAQAHEAVEASVLGKVLIDVD